MTEEDFEEDDDEILMCGPKHQLRLNLWDLSIDVEEMEPRPPTGPGRVR